MFYIFNIFLEKIAIERHMMKTIADHFDLWCDIFVKMMFKSFLQESSSEKRIKFTWISF